MPNLHLEYFHDNGLYTHGDIEDDIVRYLKDNAPEDYINVLENDDRINVFYELSDIRKSLLCWYDFKDNADVLEIGGGFGGITSMLCDKCSHVTTVDLSKRRTEGIYFRCRNKSNLDIYAGNINDIDFGRQFDYVVLVGVLEWQGQYTNSENPYTDFLKKIRSLIKPDGKMLVAIENKYGIKYWCGVQEDHTGIPFDSINGYPNGGVARTFDKNELGSLLTDAGFLHQKFYYPMPDYKLPQVIFSEKYLPSNSMQFKVSPRSFNWGIIVADEQAIYDDLAKNNVFEFFANSFLVESSPELTDFCDAIYAVVTAERRVTNQTCTIIHEDKLVTKKAFNKLALPKINDCYNNIKALNQKGIPTVEHRMDGDEIVMPLTEGITVEERIRFLAKAGRIDEVYTLLDKYWKYVLQSSDRVPSENNAFYLNDMMLGKNDVDFGVILKDVYLDLTPFNCFEQDGEYLFFDQEFIDHDLPAGYLMFRTLFHMYSMNPWFEQKININTLKERYCLTAVWDYYLSFDQIFFNKLGEPAAIGRLNWLQQIDRSVIRKNAELLLNGKNKIEQLELVTNQKETDAKNLEAQIIKASEDIKTLYQEKDALLSERDSLQRQVIEQNKRIEEIKTLNEEKDFLQSERDLLHGQVKLLSLESERLNWELNKILNSRGFKFLRFLYRMQDVLIPRGSLRREFVKIPYRLFKKIKRNFSKPKEIIFTEEKGPEVEINVCKNFYSASEIARHDWCRHHSIPEVTKFSIVIPLYNTPVNLLSALFESVENQIYGNWELCLADASPDKPEIEQFVKEKMQNSPKIKYKKLLVNGGISENTTEALKLADGDFIALLDHDDLLAPNALYEYALSLISEPDTDFFYSDKDMINEDASERVNPLLKPGYSPEIMYSANYFTHFCVIRRSILEKTSGFDKTTDGAQDWDIFLKVMEITDKIKRTPWILYHWRIISSSCASGMEAKPYVYEAQLKTLNSYISRRNWKGNIYFEDISQIRLKVDWMLKAQIRTAVVILSENGNSDINIKDAFKKVLLLKGNSKNIQHTIESMDADVLLFIDGDECKNLSGNMVAELSSWTVHPEVAFVAPLLYSGTTIMSCGLVYDDNELMDMFFNRPIGFYGQMGSSQWYRDFSLFRGTVLAIEKDKFLEFCQYDNQFGAFALSYNCLSSMKNGYRNVFNPFAKAEVTDKLIGIEQLNNDFSIVQSKMEVEKTDPYFNEKCATDVLRNNDKRRF